MSNVWHFGGIADSYPVWGADLSKYTVTSHTGMFYSVTECQNNRLSDGLVTVTTSVSPANCHKWQALSPKTNRSSPYLSSVHFISFIFQCGLVHISIKIYQAILMLRMQCKIP